MADFLIGHPNTMGQDSPDDANENYWNYGFFAQDDWRILPNLTFNLGLRYDVQTAPTDTQRRIAVFRPGVAVHRLAHRHPRPALPRRPRRPRRRRRHQLQPHLAPLRLHLRSLQDRQDRLPRRRRPLLRHHLRQRVDALAELPALRRPRDQRLHPRRPALQHIYSTDCQDFAGCVSPFPFIYSQDQPALRRPLPPSSSSSRACAGLTTSRPTSACSSSSPRTSRSQHQLRRRLQPQDSPLHRSQRAHLQHRQLRIQHHRQRKLPPPLRRAALRRRRTTTCANPAVGTKYYYNAYVIRTARPPTTTASRSPSKSASASTSASTASTSGPRRSPPPRSRPPATSATAAAPSPRTTTTSHLERQRTDNDIREQASISVVWKPDYFSHFNPVVRTLLNGWSVSAIVTLRSGKPFNITTGTDDNFDGDNNDRPNILPGQDRPYLPIQATAPTTTTCHGSTPPPTARTAPAGCPAGAGPSGLDGTVPRQLARRTRLQRRRRLHLPRLHHLRAREVPVPRRSHQRLQPREPLSPRRHHQQHRILRHTSPEPRPCA